MVFDRLITSIMFASRGIFHNIGPEENGGEFTGRPSSRCQNAGKSTNVSKTFRMNTTLSFRD